MTNETNDNPDRNTDDEQPTSAVGVEVIAQFPMAEGQELREFTHAAMDIARENLVNDGVLLPAAFVIRDRQVLLIQVTFRTAEEKRLAYAELIEIARSIGAEAIITLNDAYISEGDPEKYYPGQLEAEHAGEAIVLTLSGRAMPAWCLTQRYSRLPEGKIEFGEMSEGRGSEVGLLEGWAENPQIN